MEMEENKEIKEEASEKDLDILGLLMVPVVTLLFGALIWLFGKTVKPLITKAKEKARYRKEKRMAVKAQTKAFSKAYDEAHKEMSLESETE